jgi:hypothetical protein
MTTTERANLHDAALPERQSERPSRFYNVHLSEQDAWLGTTAAVLFNALGMLLEIALVRKSPGVSAGSSFLSGLVALALLVVLFVRRKSPSVKWASVLYLVNAGFVIMALVSTNLQFAVSAKNWVPFQATKLACLIAALVAPSFGVGLASILAHSLSALLQFQFLFPPEVKRQVGDGEPLPILAFALAGILALVYRFRRVQVEQELARTQVQNLAISRLANAFLNIRDLMNTPLQVIELSISLLRQSKEPPQPILDRMDRSVQSLREINSLLVAHEKEIGWQSKLK